MTEATPRINAQYLEQFSHQTVRILGKVRQLRGEQATVDAGGDIQVHLNRVRVAFVKAASLYCADVGPGCAPTIEPCRRDHRQSAE